MEGLSDKTAIMASRIEKISLTNFKSFDKKSLTLDGNFVAITGPNGSGKSNILDALAFVMGWRAKRLRASKVGDLIRKGASKAEVAVTIADGREEVRISREVKLNGESIYRINGRRSSAADVQELLRRLGYVVDRYTFVTQGDITSIIEMSPAERAKLIEEISGVAEYDERRSKALEELQKIDALLREFEVMLRERERELRRVEKEVRELEEREELERRLLAIEKYILMAELEEIEEEIEELEEVEISDREIDLESVRRELEREESRLRELEEEVRNSPVRMRSQIQSELASIRRKRQSLAEAIEIKEENLRSILQRSDVPRQAKEDPSFIGTVAQLIRPKPGYEVPYFAVGGPRLGDLVVRDLEGAKRIAEVLRSVKGRFRIVPLDVLRSPTPPKIKKGLGPLVDYLEFDPGFERLAWLIFNAILVNDLDSIERSDLGLARFVTMEGEIVEREGSIVAGRPESSAERISKIRAEIDELRRKLEEVDSEIRSKEELLKNLPEKDPKVDELNETRARVKELRERYERLLNERERILSRISEINERKGVLRERKRSIEARLKTLVDIEPLSVPDPNGELAAIRSRLRLMGPVNPKARDELEVRRREFEELRERYENYKRKRDSIAEAIRRIDEERESVLLRTLQELSKAFNESIAQLFEGGSGELLMTEKGLEIRVRLKDKKLASIDALSGGEKSLSALAFILAAQRLRPSSLYVFDEADAMLDGVNCKRYARVIKDLSRNAQVIVVSLKRETLEEAEQVVGVTMRNGVSKVVTISPGVLA